MPQMKSDSIVVVRIKEEGLKDSHVMEILSCLCDVYGPRLTWSPEFTRAADWAGKTLKQWGLENVHFEHWAPVGKGWTLKDFSAMVTAPTPFPVIAYPEAWSPGFKEKEADVVYLNVRNVEDFEKYSGKLKGKYVLLSDPAEIKAHFDPQAIRLADSVLLRMANADVPAPRRGGRRGLFGRRVPGTLDSMFAMMRQFGPEIDSATVLRRWYELTVAPKKLEFVEKEGALAAITEGRGDGGTLLVQSALVPQPPGVPFNQRISSYDPKSPAIVPQIVFASEHYNRIIRMLEKGERVRLRVGLEVAVTKPDSGFNVIGEIPGTDLKDEVVMVGGHFDSWHSGTGATDNGAGSAASLEAVRILETLSQKFGMKPRRTVRIGLWGGEEEGLIGSRQYVTRTLAEREGGQPGTFFAGPTGGELKKTPAYDRFSVYFNLDNGGGRIRGIYLQGNEAARPIFRRWFSAFGDPAAQTLTIQNTGGTDHLSFDGVGLPGFQFIQDPLEYEARTHHYNMDVYDRIQAPDIEQAATILAYFVYRAACDDQMFPRKPTPLAGLR
jgi:hypothetical protein